MRFRIDQKELARALTAVSRAVPQKAAMRLPPGYLIEACAPNIVNVYGSDYDILIRETLYARVEEGGKFVVPNRLFKDVVSSLTGEIVITDGRKKNEIRIDGKGAFFDIVVYDAEYFPSVEAQTSENYITIKPSELKEIIKRVGFAAGDDCARGEVFTGVLFDISDDTMMNVALDGYKLAAVKTKFEEHAEERRFILSAQHLLRLGSLLDEASAYTGEDGDEEKGVIYLNEKKAAFEFGNVYAEARLIAGNFIDYKALIPQKSKIVCRLDKAELMESVARAVLLSESHNSSLIKLHVSREKLALSSASEGGASFSEVPSEIFFKDVEDDVEEVTIGFNGHFVADTLRAIEDDRITLRLNTCMDPCLFMAAECPSPYIYLILPVRLH